MPLSQTLPGTGKATIFKCINKMRLDGDNYGNNKNSNKELLLLSEDCFAYNIFWPGKPSIFFTYLN